MCKNKIENLETNFNLLVLSVKMHTQYLSQNVFFLLIITIVIIITHGPTSLSADKYSDCGRLFECGDISVGYPFWGSDRPEHCGHPKFRLNCTEEAAQEMITISLAQGYRVVQIEESVPTLKVVSADNWNVCPQRQPHELQNTTLDNTIDATVLNNSATRVLTLFYNCNYSQLGTTSIIPNQFNCTSESTSTINYFIVGDGDITKLQGNETSGVGKCEASVVLRISYEQAKILRSIASASVENLTKAVDSGFWLSLNYVNTSLCYDCIRFNDGRCGYNLASNEFACYQVAESTSKRNLAIGIPAAVLGFLIISGAILYVKKSACATRKPMMSLKIENREFDVEAFIRNYASFTPKRYSYSNVKRMTNSFAEVIGKGGFGSVYKGKLPDGRLVAVKVLQGPKSNGSDFLNEVASIGRISHINIVTLLGFCYKGTKRALIYEYMPNGSLDKFIFNQESVSTTRFLGWKTSYEIALGIARGLEYLHLGCNTRILHFDIKPQNILLDEDFCPKIADFGLAKLWRNEESIMSMKGTRGTIGYIAPELFSRNFGGVSHKSDVYSYGMLVLELVGGRKNVDPRVSHTSEIYFPYWIYEDVELGKDLRVLGATTEEEKELSRKMVLVSFWCIQTNPLDRPSMNKVVDMLQGNLQSIQIPPKPVLSSPARSPQQSTKS